MHCRAKSVQKYTSLFSPMILTLDMFMTKDQNCKNKLVTLSETLGIIFSSDSNFAIRFLTLSAHWHTLVEYLVGKSDDDFKGSRKSKELNKLSSYFLKYIRYLPFSHTEQIAAASRPSSFS